MMLSEMRTYLVSTIRGMTLRRRMVATIRTRAQFLAIASMMDQASQTTHCSGLKGHPRGRPRRRQRCNDWQILPLRRAAVHRPGGVTTGPHKLR